MIEKQRQIEERLINVMVQLGQGRMTEAEKNAAKELRETERQLQVHKQTISRLKRMSAKLPPAEEVRILFRNLNLSLYRKNESQSRQEVC